MHKKKYVNTFDMEDSKYMAKIEDYNASDLNGILREYFYKKEMLNKEKKPNVTN